MRNYVGPGIQVLTLAASGRVRYAPCRGMAVALRNAGVIARLGRERVTHIVVHCGKLMHDPITLENTVQNPRLIS